ncbi:hypothetical protein [Isoalcanivorax beigongshangi]|uniref:Porin n=1 Tax=Isoalcanivorax beigongshangi TaxID=3238810 RepID=A0ABV4AMD3_9GAMM
MKIRSALVAAAAFCALPTLAVADKFDYTYLQGSYQVLTGQDANKWQIKGSFRINDQVYVTAQDGGIYDLRTGTVGLIAPMSDTLHLYGEFGLMDSNDGINPLLEVGARMSLNDQLQVRGALRYMSDVYDTEKTALSGMKGVKDDDELLIALEANYRTSERFSFIGGVSIPTEADGVLLEIGGRLHF